MTAALGTTANPAQAQITNYTWNDSSSDWLLSTTWTPNALDWTDSTRLTDAFAVFGNMGSITNPPDIGSNQIYVNGLSFNNSGVAWELSGSGGLLTIDAGGIQVTGGKTTTITTDLELSTIQDWNLGSGNTLTHTGSLLGSGEVSVIGGGTVNLEGDLNGFGGALGVSSGTLNVTGAADGYSGTFSVSAGATLRIATTTSGNLFLADETSNLFFAPATTITYGGTIDGSGSTPGTVTFLGPGTTIFRSPSNFDFYSVTVESGATLQFGDDNGAGSFNADILNNGKVVFYQFGSTEFGKVISGPGSVVKDGPDTLAFTSIQKYTGPTTILNGTLELTNDGSLDQSSTITVGAGATFAINSSYFVGQDSNKPQTLQGAGTVQAFGTGDLTIDSSTIRGGIANSPDALGTLTVDGSVTFAKSGTAFPTLQVEASKLDINDALASKIEVINGNSLNLISGFKIDVKSSTNVDNGTTILANGETYSITLATAGSIKLNGVTLSDGPIDPSDYTLASTDIGFEPGTVSLGVENGGTDLVLSFVVAPIPEPAAVLGIAFGALAVGGLVRRRWRKPADFSAKA